MLENWARAGGLAGIFFAVLVCSFLWGLSYQTPKHDYSDAKTKAQTSQKAEQAADKVPPAIALSPSPKEAPEAERAEWERYEKLEITRATWVLAVATVWLFIAVGVQALLFVWQLRLIKEGLKPAEQAAKAAEEAAKAANLNAQAVIDAERAYMFGGGPAIGGDSPEYMYGTIDNYGRTPGFLKRVDWGICDEADFPTNISVYSIIESGCLPMEKIEIEDVYPSTPKGNPYYPLRFPFLRNIGRIFFGRFVYHDIYGKYRYSTFKLKLDKERGSIPLPGCYSDWS
jgi:hypothetical protein